MRSHTACYMDNGVAWFVHVASHRTLTLTSFRYSQVIRFFLFGCKCLQLVSQSDACHIWRVLYCLMKVSPTNVDSSDTVQFCSSICSEDNINSRFFFWGEGGGRYFTISYMIFKSSNHYKCMAGHFVCWLVLPF